MIKSGQWQNVIKLIVWAITSKQSWDNFYAMCDDKFFLKEVQSAVARYKKETKWTETPTSNMDGLNRWLAENKK